MDGWNTIVSFWDDLFAGAMLVSEREPILAGPSTPPRNKGLIAGLIKGNQTLISPDHKAGYFWGGYIGGDRLTSHDVNNSGK